ncbi:MAG: OmpA family protein [Bacteroidota bacterium]|nr:OmpA family protein [Bacteroidota bacterium]
MWRYLLCIVGCLNLFSQEEIVYSVYFEFDKYNLKDEQKQSVVKFIKELDSTLIESISIYGYTDDRGKDDYNYKLSTNRANTIKDELLSNGIKNKIIISIEGKGKILIDDDLIGNISEVRSKNRRVDVVANLKAIEEEGLDIPGVYETITSDNVVGDRIYLKNLLFDRGSSKLTNQSKKELDKMVKLLQKYKNYHFEIQGHVCCTPKFHKEAVDRDTKKRELSKNRAEAVYKYLVSKKINKSRMTFRGFGTSAPLGKDPRLDRRVEFLITKK